MADRRIHSRWDGMGLTNAQQQRRQPDCISDRDSSSCSIAVPSNANQIQPSGPVIVDPAKSGQAHMPDIMSMSTCTMELVPDMAKPPMMNQNSSSYSSLLHQDDPMDVFDFHQAPPLPPPGHDIADQGGRNGDMLSGFLDSSIPTDLEMPRLASNHCPSCHCSSTGSTTKTFSGDSGSSVEERLDFVVESVQNAGFRNIDDMVLSYYTASLDEDSDLFHEQRMSRQRGLPSVLSRLRNSATTWQQYEREAYEAEILQNAEYLLADECRRLFSSSAFKERLAHMRSGKVDSAAACSSASSSLYESGYLSGCGNSVPSHSPPSSVSAPAKTWLLEELPNVWKLMSALSGCRPGSQSVASLLLMLCFADHLQGDGMRNLLQSTTI